MSAEERDPSGEFEPNEGPIEEHSLIDELSRGLATGALSRGQALKLTGAAMLGGALVFFSFSQPAEARRRRRRRRGCPTPGTRDAQTNAVSCAAGNCLVHPDGGTSGCCLPQATCQQIAGAVASFDCTCGGAPPPPPPECVTDGDCPEGQVCEAGECVLPTCQIDDDCPLGQDEQACLLPQGVCVLRCDTGTCPTGFSCAAESDLCLPECPDGDCPAPSVCVVGICLLQCDNDACPGPGFRCAEEPNVCLPTCPSVDGDTACPDDYQCVEDAALCLPSCAGDPCPAVGFGCENVGDETDVCTPTCAAVEDCPPFFDDCSGGVCVSLP